MPVPNSMQDYLRMFAGELGNRILESFPALHNAHDPVSPRLATLLRKPFPAQTVAAMGVAKKWETERSAAVIVTLIKTWPNRPQLWFISLRPNYGLAAMDADWMQ